MINFIEYAPSNVKLVRNDMYSFQSQQTPSISSIITKFHENSIIEIDIESSENINNFCQSMSRAFRQNFEWFEHQNCIEDVSITGISDNLSDGPGSTRFSTMSKNLSAILDVILENSAAIPQLNTQGIGQFVKVSEYFRFMRYKNSGQHYPHYDSDFAYNPNYYTKYSMVLYHEYCNSGELFFCNDNRILNNKDLTTDWDRQASDKEIYLKIKPNNMKLVLFPHTLCHGVLPFTEDERNIIRGDLIFKVN